MNKLIILFACYMLIFLNVINPTNVRNLTDLTSDFRNDKLKITKLNLENTKISFQHPYQITHAHVIKVKGCRDVKFTLKERVCG